MEEIKTTEKAEKVELFNAEKFDRLVEKYRNAPGPEARAKIIADSGDLAKKGVRLARKFEREAMPMYAQCTGRLEENAVYDKVRLVRDTTLTAVAGIALYKAGKIAYTWLTSP